MTRFFAGKVYGINLTLGNHEHGLWLDRDKKEYQPNGFGIKLALVAGDMIWPIKKFWEKDNNPWHGGEPLYVVRIPFIFLFLSGMFGKYRFYIGCKDIYIWHPKHTGNDRYGKWLKPEEAGTEDNPKEYLQLSARMTSSGGQ